MSYGEQAFDAIYESVSSSHGKCIFHDGDDLRQLVPQLLNQADRKELACPETTITKPGVYLVGLWTDDIASFKRVHSHLVEKGLAGYLGHLTLPLRLTPVEFGQQMIDWRLPASISLVDGKVVKGTSKYGIGINKNDHSLLDVAKRGQLENVKGLIGNGADVHEENADKRGGQFITHNEDSITALMGASEKGDFKMVQALLADGADVNAKNKDGETALMYASGEGHLEVVQLLLANGADVNAKNSRGETALFMASVGGRLEVVQLLLANKADVNAKRDGCETALMMASMIGHKDVRELLIRAGAK
jgi:ankyrin repeat protein